MSDMYKIICKQSHDAPGIHMSQLSTEQFNVGMVIHRKIPFSFLIDSTWQRVLEIRKHSPGYGIGSGEEKPQRDI